jgi:hypothetical protein
VNNQEILDNAPEGATHVLFQSINYIYIKFGVHTQGLMYCNHKKGWRLATHVLYSNLRSLADIKRIAELENQVEFEMGQKAIAREQRQRVISSLNSYLIKRANEIGECLPIYLVDHIKEFKGGAE